MSEASELPIVKRLTRREDGYPQTGRGSNDASGRGTIEMDPAPQVLVNPDGPQAAAIIMELVRTLQSIKGVGPLTRGLIDSALICAGAKQGTSHG